MTQVRADAQGVCGKGERAAVGLRGFRPHLRWGAGISAPILVWRQGGQQGQRPESWVHSARDTARHGEGTTPAQAATPDSMGPRLYTDEGRENNVMTKGRDRRSAATPQGYTHTPTREI